MGFVITDSERFSTKYRKSDGQMKVSNTEQADKVNVMNSQGRADKQGHIVQVRRGELKKKRNKSPEECSGSEATKGLATSPSELNSVQSFPASPEMFK